MPELRLLDRSWRDKYTIRRLGDFVARCRQRGIAVTPQRLAVIRALLATDNHPSTDEICVAVRREHPHVSLATVHRILEQFCDVGEARKVTLLHDVARYDGNVEPHHHVLCVRCRCVQDIEMPEVDKLLEGTSRLGQFVLLRCSLEIEALCERCQLAERRDCAQDSDRTHSLIPHRSGSGPANKSQDDAEARERKKMPRQVPERKSGGHEYGR